MIQIRADCFETNSSSTHSITLVTKNECGNSEKFRNALMQLYETEEFKNLEAHIKDRLGPPCKGIRFDESYGWGYIDDSYDAVEEFCTYKEYDVIEFIFGNYYLNYHYDG